MGDTGNTDKEVKERNNMSRVLVTGACGFLGSHVCEHFKDKGWEVIGLDNMTNYELARTGFDLSRARKYNRNLLHKLGISLAEVDVRDYFAILTTAERCDYIVHCAAQPAMTLAIEDPFTDFKVNVEGGVNVLQVARKLEIPVALCSTIHVYGNRLNQHLEERETRYWPAYDSTTPASISEAYPDMQGEITPLHASKKALEVYGQAWIDTYRVRVGIFRLSGMYGPRQFGGEDHGWIANFAIRTLLGRPITVYGTGKQVRDILYATDAARLFECFYNSKGKGLYTVGGGLANAISLIECLDWLRIITEKEQDIVFKEDRQGDLRYFVCDNSKAKRELRWTPTVEVTLGLRKLVKWVEEVKEIL